VPVSFKVTGLDAFSRMGTIVSVDVEVDVGKLIRILVILFVAAVGVALIFGNVFAAGFVGQVNAVVVNSA
jgi:hypothetical protein